MPLKNRLVRLMLEVRSPAVRKGFNYLPGSPCLRDREIHLTQFTNVSFGWPQFVASAVIHSARKHLSRASTELDSRLPLIFVPLLLRIAAHRPNPYSRAKDRSGVSKSKGLCQSSPWRSKPRTSPRPDGGQRTRNQTWL